MTTQLVYPAPMPKTGYEKERAVDTASAAPMVDFIERNRDSSATFADEIGVTRQTLSNWKARGIPLREVERVARGMGLTYDEYMALSRGQKLFAREPPPDGKYVYVPRYEAVGGLGSGRINEQHVEISGTHAYRADWIDRNGWRPEALVVIGAEGPSMEPTINDGDVVLVNTDQTKIISGRVYAIEDADHGTRIKRLIRTLDGRVRVVSDNQDKRLYPDDYLTPDTGARIIGEVVHRSGRI